MKFEGGIFKTTGKEPDTLDDFFKYFNYVTRFLSDFNTKRLNIVENLAHYNTKLAIPHMVEKTITHRLGYTPKTIILNGRVEWYQITFRDVSTINVKAKLASALIMVPQYNLAHNRILVSDSSIFVVNDKVRIGVNNNRTITGIDKGRLVLDSNVIYDESINTVTLASENCNVFVI